MSNEKLGIIAGSNAHTLLEEGRFALAREGEVDTPFGKTSPIYRIKNRSEEVFLLLRHGENGYDIAAPFVNYRANLYALKRFGVSAIISWSGPGAIIASYSIGEFILPYDAVDETKHREDTFYKNTGLGFIRQNPPFCPSITSLVLEYFPERGIDITHKGIYVCTEGPRLETKAEIQKYALYGATMVGMTLMPEMFLARELEMCYRPICYITNYAEGVVERAYSKGELFEGMNNKNEKEDFNKAVKTLPAIISEAIDAFYKFPEKRICSCRDSMLRYKRSGRIEEDWWKKLRM